VSVLVLSGEFLHRILEQAPDRPDSILPADLLAFFVGTSPVANANLVDAQPALGDFHRDFGFESESVFFDGNRLDDLSPEGFVARLHIAEVDICEAIGKQRKQPISNRVPKIQNTMWSAAEKTRAVDHVGFSLNERI